MSHFLFRFNVIPYPITRNPNIIKSIIKSTLRNAIATPTLANRDITNKASKSMGKLIFFIRTPLFLAFD